MASDNGSDERLRRLHLRLVQTHLRSLPHPDESLKRLKEEVERERRSR